jgi:hypothetical protein
VALAKKANNNLYYMTLTMFAAQLFKSARSYEPRLDLEKREKAPTMASS